MPFLPLETMTLEEKLQAMEELWADLCRKDPHAISPEWHRDVLEEREAALARGEITYEDFDMAKARLLKEIEKNRGR